MAHTLTCFNTMS